MEPQAVGAAERAELAQVFGRIAQFTFVLGAVGRFPATAYLALEDPAPFVALTAAVVARFPQYPPYGGAYDTVVPHLTVADGDAAGADEAEHAMRKILAGGGPMQALCSAVSLLENSSGRWRQMDEFALARNPTGARGRPAT